MKTSVSFLILAAVASSRTFGQDTAPRAHQQDVTEPSATPIKSAPGQPLSARQKFGFYLTETYWNPAIVTGGAFRAGIRMASPPNQYPREWKQGFAGFGRNFGDAFAESASLHTARALTGIVTREDPRYQASSSRNPLARTLHALAFTFVDRSDSGHPMPAFSNFAGAAAGGFVGNAYLPSGFTDLTHARQRATIAFGSMLAGNLYQEFAPQIPKPIRVVFALLAR